jgi:hypothetical protein
MADCSPDIGQPEAAGCTLVRVLRWTYRRSDEAVICELGLDRHDAAYELKLNPPKPTGETVEFFRDAIAALMRQAAIERTLVSEGWSLERFESHRTVA